MVRWQTIYGYMERKETNNEQIIKVLSFILSKLDTLPQNVRDDIVNNGVLGHVTDRFYENKVTGDHKYKVDFAGVGSVGIKLSDLEFVN